MEIKTSKYNRLWLILLFLVPGFIFGKTNNITYPKHIGIGVKSGATLSSLYFRLPIKQMNSSFVPTYGLIFTYVDKKTVGVQVELNYVTKSWEENISGDTLFNATLNYIEIPMLTTLHFGNRFKFLVNFGPYLSILLNEESSHTIVPESEYFDYYEKRNPRGGDFGMMGGAGFRLQTKLGLFQIEGRYTFSLQNLYDTQESNLDFSNLTTIGVFLSYQFLLSNGH